MSDTGKIQENTKQNSTLKIRITPGGLFGLTAFIALFILGFISGLNDETARQNLFYSLAAAIFSLFILGLPIAFINLSRLKLSRKVPEEIVAGSSFTAMIKIQNLSKKLPRFALKVDDDFADANDVLNLLSKPIVNEGYCISITPGKTAALRFQTTIQNRGIINLNSVKVSSLFPFSLLKLTKIFEVKDNITVFPKPIKSFDFTQKIFGAFQSSSGALKPKRASIDEYFGVREYKTGDNPRFIHWKMSARRNSLMMKEFLEESLPPILILLDTQVLNRKRLRFALEKAISIVAGISEEIIQRNQRLSFIADNIEVASGTGHRHFARILTALAHVNSNNESNTIENIISTINPKYYSDSAVFIITLRKLRSYKLHEFEGKFNFFLPLHSQDLTFG